VKAAITHSSPPKNRAIRLTFSYKGNNISLITQQNIEKMLPSSLEPDYDKNLILFWYEITDSRKNILHRQIIDNPIKADMEIFSLDPRDSIVRQKRTDIRGAFSLVIPDIPEADSFDLFKGAPLSEGVRESQRTQNIFHLDLTHEKVEGQND
jgi:hypothetical protein